MIGEVHLNLHLWWDMELFPALKKTNNSCLTATLYACKCAWLKKMFKKNELKRK